MQRTQANMRVGWASLAALICEAGALPRFHVYKE